MKIHSSIRLRRWVPMLGVGPVVLMLVASAVWRDWQGMNEADVAVRNLLGSRLADERVQVEYLLRTRDHLYLSEQMVQFGAVPEIEVLVLVDPNGVVRFSKDANVEGRRLEEILPEYPLGRFRSGQEDRRIAFEIDPKRRFLLAWQPVRFPAEAAQVGSQEQGTLLIKYDLRGGRETIRRRVVAHTLVEIAFAVMVVVVLIVVLRRWLSLPIKQLEGVLDRIGGGDLAAEIEVSGAGEIARLCGSISQMQRSLVMANDARDLNLAALKASEERFRVLFEQAAIGVAEINSVSGAFVRVNKCYGELVGYSVGELLNTNFQSITHPEDLPPDLENMRLLVAGEISEFVMEKRLYRKDGSPVWVLLTVSPMWRAGETPDFHIAVVQDITKRKEAEAALRESEKRHVRVVSVLFEGVLTQSKDGEILTWNPAAERILGLSGDQMRGRTSLDPRWRSVNADGSVLAGEDHPSMVALRTKEPQLDVELGVHKPDGQLTWLSVNAVPVFEAGEELPSSVVVSFADVTERKRAQDSVRRSERFLKTIIETEPECVKIVNSKGELLEMNAAGLEMLEADSVKVVEEKGLGAFILPAYRAAFGALHHKVMAGGRGLLEFEVLGLRGTRRWLETHAAPLRDDSGRVGLLLGITRDITERKKTEEALRESLGDKEALLREVHHRVKNNLQVIVSLLRMEGGRNVEPETKGVLRDMQGRIQSMALLHELLYRSGTFATVDLGSYIRQVSTHVFRASARKPSSIELGLDLDSISLKLDQAMPLGLLVNELVSNCLKHAFPNDREGEIRVELRLDPGGTGVRLSVCDNGRGLPVDFDVERSATLGMQLVSDLAKQLGGVLLVRSNQGTEVSVTFSC